ncbi:MAG: hypothetical protein O2894_09335, partial [Planctomycetota bacterium]|nr:hypothetical protein [Planctomycetota bacterium]
MRGWMALVLAVALVAAGCSSGSSAPQPAAPPSAVSITSAPRSGTSAWTTPPSQTVFSGSPRGVAAPAYANTRPALAPLPSDGNLPPIGEPDAWAAP